MTYTQNIDNCFESKISENGLKKEFFAENLQKANQALEKIKHDAQLNNFAILNHLETDDDIEEIISIGDEIRDNFDELIVLGTGGSTLNPQSLVCLKQPHKDIDKKVYFIDNVDSFTIESFIEQIDFATTAILVTSKSGRTLETLVQFVKFIEEFENRNIEVSKHFYVITDPAESPIKDIALEIGAKILDHEKDIGGRFSSFTNVGLIPAHVAGVDIRKIRAHAKSKINEFLTPNSAPAQGAALQFSFMQKGIASNVMMPYIDRLSPFVSWYRQIWAESLGKAGKGSTAIKALGSLDQHSQLQLYLDGPKDKIFTIISCEKQASNCILDSKYLPKESAYLAGKSINDVNCALQQATSQTLTLNKRPLREIVIENLDEKTLSEITLHFAMETIITAHLLQVNPFDQPAVENGKKIAVKLLEG